MKSRKKILALLIKLLIGIGSVFIIYFRLKGEFTEAKLTLLYSAFVSPTGLWSFALCLLLMPVNWGIESRKWQLITLPVENIGYGRASRSVYSGVCLGNFAPGRATEFLAKILFFEADSRPKVTVLHFMNGMFQFSVTVIVGFLALLIRLKDFGENYSWLIYLSGGIGLFMLSLLFLSIYNVEALLRFFASKLGKENRVEEFGYKFSPRVVFTLFVYSALRYFVFFSQFTLLLNVFFSGDSLFVVLTGISIYFLVTATIPMFSVVEAAIRAAVALVVFKNCGIPDTGVALCTILMWLVNIILPSIAGYYFLWKENFNFKFLNSRA